MASDMQPLSFMNTPLEVRHHIFEYIAVRDVQHEKLLRYWFEKKGVKEKIAELVAQNSKTSAPRVVYEGDQFEHDEHEEEGDSEGNGGDESDEDGGQDSDEDEDEDEETETSEEDFENEGAEMDGTDSTAIPLTAPTLSGSSQGETPSTPAALPSTMQDLHNSATTAQNAASAVIDQSSIDTQYGFTTAMAVTNVTTIPEAQASTASLSTSTTAAVQAHYPDGTGGQEVDAEVDKCEEEYYGDALGGAPRDEGAEPVNREENEKVKEVPYSDSDEEMGDGNGDADAAAQSAVSTPVITAHRKWRHIPQFMRITHCPPPVELLLASKQLNAEVKSWFYDVAVLHIEATGSFAHTSFFEEAFSQITEAAFSPMEDIRKVEVRFVWDTTWLRSEQADCATAIFPALLRQRAIFVTGILAQAPNLSEVIIHWHDSAQDEEAVDLMNDVLVGFLGLDANVKVEPYYIAADAKPPRKSIAGKQRVEFQRIVNNGLDRLF